MTILEKIIKYLAIELGHQPSNDELAQRLNGVGLIEIIRDISNEEEDALQDGFNKLFKFPTKQNSEGR